MAKKLNQQDLLKLSTINTPPTDSVAFAAKSDGLYQKIGTVESKLSTTAELLNRVGIPVPANAKFTDTIVDISGKVDKVTGKGLSTNDYTSTEKVKLNNIEEGANKYSHPSTHPYSMITGVPTKLSEFTNDLGNYGSWITKAQGDSYYAPKSHTHSNFTRTVSGFVPAPGLTTTTRYLREDGTWVIPPNTTYSAMSVAEGTAGTATSLRTMRADYLKEIIQHYDTNTTYSAGSGLTLSGTQFSLPVTVTGDGTFVKSVTQGTNGVSVTLGTPPNTNTTYSTGTLVQLRAGTDTTGRLQTAKLLNEWLSEKGYITSYIDTTYTAGTNIQISGTNVISATDTKYSLPTASGTTLGGVKIGSNISITSGVISVAAPYSHPSSHPASMITGLHSSATSGVAGSVAWGNVSGKPSTFAPATHTHSNITITAGTGLSGGGALSASRTLSIASTYAPNTSTSLGASQNLNNYQTAGFYHQTANANATTALNYPVASAGSLLVQTAAGVIQTYKVYSSSDVYVRGYSGTTWTVWRKLVNASDSIPWARITGAPTTATTHPTWAQVTSKPSTFTPSSHTHTIANITDLGNIATINKNNSTANYLRGDGTWKTPPNTTYVEATTSANGLMSSGDKTKLNGIATGANNYSHPTGAGNNHIPSGGAAGQFLKWSASGVAVWAADNNTKYIEATTSANGLMSSGDKTKLNGIATGANKYSHPTTPGNKHIPSGGATNQILRYSDDGTAVWSAEKNTTYTALASGGLTLSAGNAFSVKYGTTLGTACAGNDSRLSNARPPTTHTHAWSQITNRPTKLSEFTFDLTSWTGNLTISGTLTANALFKSSDVRLKELIQPINTSNIDNIDLIEFNWKDSGKKDYGVKAQDVEVYYPELVNTDDTGIKSVNYESLYAIKIARLEERIKELEDKLCQKN